MHSVLNTIAIAQLNPTLGDTQGNVALIIEAARAVPTASLLVTPELATTGYSPMDLLDDPHFEFLVKQAQAQLVAASLEFPDMHWLVGMPVANRLAGKKWHNSAVLIKNGQVLWTYHKQLLPTYNIFHDYRHFEPGSNTAPVIVINGVRVGLCICEDAWNYKGKAYAKDPVQQLIDGAPELIISLNASPSHVGKQSQRRSVINAITSDHQGIPFLYVNQVGGHDEIISDGGSFVSFNGKVVFELPFFTDAVELLELDQFFEPIDAHCPRMLATPAYRMRDSAPICIPAQFTPESLAYHHIILGLRDYCRRTGFTSVVVGSSGGIDSALTLALACDALGAKNVHAVTMPSDFSSSGSVSDSVALCRNLGVSLDTLPIAPIVNSVQAGFSLPSAMHTPLEGLSLENLQARIRGTLLMGYSNARGYLLLTTGNKSETAVGYCTLYGDTNGGFNVLGDLYKTEVFALARFYNEIHNFDVIPLDIITKEPSAELAPGQRDSDSLPSYPVLDHILKYLLEFESIPLPEVQPFIDTLRAIPNSDALITKISHMLHRNEYKRRQLAPAVRIHPRAFGAGRRIPLTASRIPL